MDTTQQSITPVDDRPNPLPEVNLDDKPLDPNIHLYQWLNDNEYELSVGTLDEKTPFLDSHGFVLTDKPLLVIRCKKKEDK